MEFETMMWNLKVLMRRVGKPLGTQAREAGLSGSALSVWDKGTIPRVDKLIEYMNYTGISPNELFGYEEPKPEPKPHPKPEPKPHPKPDTTKCRTCIYRAYVSVGTGKKNYGCQYILLTGEKRPCKPGKECTAYRKIEGKEKPDE